MKNYFIISLLILSVGFSQDKVNVNNLVQYGDKWFKENDDTPFSGIGFDMSKKTGKKILEFGYTDGLLNGKYFEWYEGGEQKVKGIYKDGKIDGEWIEWFSNGKMMIKENYIDEIKNGNSVMYYENGNKWIESNFLNGEFPLSVPLRVFGFQQFSVNLI